MKPNSTLTKPSESQPHHNVQAPRRTPRRFGIKWTHRLGGHTQGPVRSADRYSIQMKPASCKGRVQHVNFVKRFKVWKVCLAFEGLQIAHRPGRRARCFGAEA